MSRKILGLSPLALTAVAAVGMILYQRSRAKAPVSGLGYMPALVLAGSPNDPRPYQYLAGVGALGFSFKKLTRKIKKTVQSSAVKRVAMVASGGAALLAPQIQKIAAAHMQIGKKIVATELKRHDMIAATLGVKAAQRRLQGPQRRSATPVQTTSSDQPLTVVDASGPGVTYDSSSPGDNVSYSDTVVPVDQPTADSVQPGDSASTTYDSDAEAGDDGSGATQRFDNAPSGTNTQTTPDATESSADAQPAAAPASGTSKGMLAAGAAAAAWFLLKR